MSFLAGMWNQHTQNATQNNATAANAQDAFNKSMVDLMGQVNAGNTALFNAQTNNLVAKNDIATKNPSTFARQSALAGILGHTPELQGASAVKYAGPGDTAKVALSELQQQAINNLLKSPKDNPVPSGATTAVTPTNVAAPTLHQFGFDNYAPQSAFTAVPGNVPPGTATPRV